ncbi:sensor histidine kinase virs [[Clostridium] sordellii]|uniref:ATP-binding protein n=4 Tax=Paraclostridium sordellii TaxID=1505 RepID=UPI0005E88545|nr:ATP-binding protein [Paeniclostridium sordellii]MDU4414442.1 ATP-binding protein [Paeniclostridium sordellii]CEO08169.1 sensor histidine kinase virs [[Clostridium] sordellii] [Paeniclostridium sordellii]CEO34772.1 sensor histidine kinase virs [[Clostridium] sordellii] [Paeniclostridium sordellii]CEP87119.1 sensor histidine kinase virs [[Clostridium] sordellii] [Paeniclostridium sordellii]CEP93225.1 sensor histidine kinase virs [[Clostridium] sordellii] [Paeniclostridium sordellii]
MLNFMNKLVVVLSILIPLIILKGILTYKKEGRENNEIVFYILLLIIYILARLFNIKYSYSYFNNINYLFDLIVFIVMGIYYNYFYKIGYVKYIILFYLFNVYYDLFKEVIYRILYIVITGYSVSSEGSLLISNINDTKIRIYSYILIIFIYIILMFINNRLQLFSSEKRNYIYLTLALMINIINIIGRYAMGVYSIGNNLSLNQMLYDWRMSAPALQDEWHYFDQFVIPKLVVASTIIILLLFRRAIKENKKKIQNELMKNKLDMQYEHYLSVQESHMKVKKLYHDINNHICCIDNLKNNNKEVSEYINNLKDEIKSFKDNYNTGNMILDIIINEKSDICSKKGIKFICDINFSKVDFIKPIDVSSIFANILDNAIEACDKIHDEDVEKYIRIKGTISKAYFVIKCENSKVNNIKFKKNKLLTDKMDKFVHGIGTQSIKSSLDKYDGELLFEDEKNKFILNLYIPLNQNTDSWVD